MGRVGEERADLRRPWVVDRQDGGAGGLHDLRRDERLVDRAEEEVAPSVVVEHELWGRGGGGEGG